MYIALFMKYKNHILYLLVLLLVAFGLYKYNRYHYNKGYEQGVLSQKVILLEYEKKLQEQLLAYNELQAQIANEYETNKKHIDKQKEIEYVEVQKIIEKPVYLNNCIDDNGLSKLNSIITGKTNTITK